MGQLDKYEKTTLEGCEQVIEEGKRTFVEVGNALMKIRDGKLYRADFDTFEEYCQKRWGWKKSQAYRMMDSAAVVANLKTSPIGELPATESQARPLAKLEPEQQREAWQRAQDRAQAEKRAVTAADVTEAVTYTIDPVEAAKPVTESATSNAPTVRIGKGGKQYLVESIQLKEETQTEPDASEGSDESGPLETNRRKPQQSNKERGSYEDWKQFKAIAKQIHDLVKQLNALVVDKPNQFNANQTRKALIQELGGK